VALAFAWGILSSALRHKAHLGGVLCLLDQAGR
jgi:hypothetical protein